MIIKKQAIIFSTLLLLAAGFLFTFPGTAETVMAESGEAETIKEGVRIGTVDVGGMTAEEASAAVDRYVEGLMETTFTLTGAEGSVEVTAEDMGISADAGNSVEQALHTGKTGTIFDRYCASVDLKNGSIVLPLTLEVNKQQTAKLIYKNRMGLNIEAVNATLKRENNQFVFVPGTVGHVVDEVQSVYAINDFLKYQYADGNNQINLVIKDVQPKGKEEDLMKIKDLMGSFSTNYSSSAAGRKANVANACAKINGSVVYPGEEFSVYKAISPMTEENGYELAGAYENGTVVESLGGGVCQVATTLYNAIIRAELDVTKRYNHSMIVGYVPASGDAAIAGTYKDLRFVNTYDTPVYIEGSSNGGTLTFRVYGVETRPSNRKVEFESVELQRDEPTYQFEMDASQALGYYHTEQSAHLHVVAQLWKVVYEDGKEVSREQFNSSNYKASPKILTVGTGGCTPEQMAVISNAIATSDEGTVKAAIAQAQSMTAPATPEEPAAKSPEKGNETGTSTPGGNTGTGNAPAETGTGGATAQ